MIKKEGGFTLVEVTVGVALIGLVVGLVSGLFMMVHSIQRQALHTEVATRAAQRQMESLRNNNYNSLEPGETIIFTDKLPPNLPQSTGVVTVTEPNAELRRVEISVKYFEGTQEKEVRITSLVGILGITQ